MSEQTIDELPWYLKLYDEVYFSGGNAVSGYDEYANCRGVLFRWSEMVAERLAPLSLLDVGAAYGFVVYWFRRNRIPAEGIEPSPYAQKRAWLSMIPGALPDLPDTPRPHYDVVTCTECLEHVPPELVPASLAALAAKTKRALVMLIMLEGPGADGDAGHICLRSREWWESELDQTGLVRDAEAEQWFNDHPFSQEMKWSGRLFVRVRP